MTETTPVARAAPDMREPPIPSVPPVPYDGPGIVQSNGIELCYDAYGERDAPTILLIMGVGAQMIYWDDEFCALLAARGYRVVRFDNRDVGLSTRLDEYGVPNLLALTIARLRGKPITAPYRLRDMADDAVGLLDALGIDRTHVVGASVGGAIGQEMALHHPHRLHTLTAMMSSTGDLGLPRPTLKALAMLLAPVPRRKEAFVRYYCRALRTFRGPGFPLDEARDRTRAYATYARGPSPAGVGRQLAAMLASGSRAEALKDVTVPTLVIHGDADPLMPLPCGIDLAERIPGAKRLIVEGMGHGLSVTLWHHLVEAIAQHAV